MATPYNLVSVDAQTRLTEFSAEFDGAMALSPVTPWARSLGRAGLINTSRAIKTSYPIPVSAAGYKLRKGDEPMRRLYQKTISALPVEWTDGVAEKASIVEAPDFFGWAGEPSRIADEAVRLPNTLVAALLESNPTLGFDGLSLFNDAHPCNVFDSSVSTFDNRRGAGLTAIDAATMSAMVTHFRSIKGPNGKPMGRRLTDLLVPAVLEQQAKAFLNSDLMYAAFLAAGTNTNQVSNNIYKGSVNLIVSDELTAADQIYGIDRNGPPVFIYQDGGAPEEILYTKDDELYKDEGLIGVKYVLLAVAVAALPHSIVRVKLGSAE